MPEEFKMGFFKSIKLLEGKENSKRVFEQEANICNNYYMIVLFQCSDNILALSTRDYYWKI